MAKQPTSKYTPSMVARIQAVAVENGALNLELATRLAADAEFVEAGVTARGIVMKTQSLGLPYQKVERKDKAGEAVMAKAEMASAIAEILGVDELDSLTKVEKNDLRKLLDAVKREMLVDVYAD